MTRIRMRLLLGLLLALALAVAGCGDNKPSGVASLGGTATRATATGGSSDPRQAALAWARCMRQHGVNLPDPLFSRNGGIRLQGPPKSDGIGPDHPRFKAAQQRVAPEEIHYHVVVRELLRELLKRERRSATPGLRPLAQRVGAL